MSLLDLYNSWSFRAGNTLGNKTPVDQSQGKIAVDFLPNTYQTEVRNRVPGDKAVLQATGDDNTFGTFNTTSAFKRYTTLFNDTSLRVFKGKEVHKYNAQGPTTAKYITSNNIVNTPGAQYFNG
jgi:hypothetical protein